MANKFNSKSSHRGHAILISVLFLSVVSVIVIAGLVSPVVRSLHNANQFVASRVSYYTAEAAIEDVVYRLKNGLEVPTNDSLSLNGGTADFEIIDDGGTDKTIEVVGIVDNLYRKIRVALTVGGTGNAFFYGIQAGNGGFVLQGGSQINGNVYSNSYITSTNGERITGSAIVANLSTPTANQSNTNPATPSQSIVFGSASATQDFGQSFQVSQDIVLNKVRLYIKKTSNPGNLTVRIAHDSAGKPATTYLDSATLNSSLVTTAFGWVEVSFAGYVPLDAGTTYWLVLDGASNASKYYTMAANSSYVSGTAKIGRFDNSTWVATSPVDLDGYFEVFGGGGNSTIGGGTWMGATRIGTVPTDIAWGYNITGANVSGPLYCQTGSHNNKACDTSRGIPPPVDMPISDANIDAWKAEALAGGSVGSLAVGWQNATTGPKKINGNLTIDGGGTLTLTGTVWVTGNVTVSGGGKIKLASSYGENSGVLIADGVVILSGDGQFSGSGQAGSYPVLITTSNCPYGPTCAGSNALSLTGGSGAVILVAQNGTLSVNGGSAARSLVGYKIHLSGGASVTYDVGLSSLLFSSGPSAGFEINGWAETP